MAEASVHVKYLDDITECPICTNIYTDPRVLPCIHTYCLKCIEGWSQKRKPEEKLTCPLCRKEVNIASEKLDVELPKNLFVEKLMEVRKLSSVLVSSQETLCDVCDGSKSTSPTKAILYCVDCHQNMCQQCSRVHKNIRSNSSHKTIEFGCQLLQGDILVKLSEITCDKHRNKNLEIYCIDCKMAICLMCYLKSHKSHDVSDVNEVAEELSNQMKKDGDDISRKSLECQEVLKELSGDEKSFLDNINTVERDITGKAEELKKLIDKFKMEQLDKLRETKTKQVKQIENVRQEVEGLVMMLDNFKMYSEQLSAKGAACDIAREASGLRARAKELMEFDVKGKLTADVCQVEVMFAGQLEIQKFKQIFGELSVKTTARALPEMSPAEDTTTDDNFMSSTEPVKVIPPTGQGVTGLATLGDELFVVRWNSRQVNVYDVTTFNTKRQLALSRKATSRNRGLAACDTNMCLYVSDDGSNCIHKVDVEGKTRATQWTVGEKPWGLSVNSDHNVLVACRGANSIQEYTPVGVQVRDISLQSDMTVPIHVIQLSSGQYGVIHRGSYHRYCVVDVKGQVVKSYGSTPGSDVGQLNLPFGLAVNKRGFVFIANCSGNRLVVLDPVSFTATQLSVDGELNCPYCVHLDKSGRRLYIGEWMGSRNRVIVLEQGSS